MDECKNQKIPKETIFEYRPAKENDCKIYTNQEEKLKQMTHTNLPFVNRRTNFKMLTLAEHRSTDSMQQRQNKINNPLYQCEKLL